MDKFEKKHWFNKNKKRFFNILQFSCIGVGIISFFWIFTILCAAPNKEYLTESVIEGRHHCFHTTTGGYFDYYTKVLWIHKREGSFTNKDSTLVDDFENIAKEYKFYDKLKASEYEKTNREFKE
tara:strand:+ start:2343 stop:2714 length:372 start_codon:yes stop_codon:yes gene_type:complete